MEHTHGNLTLAVLARFIRRYWRVPAQLAGLIAVVLVLLMALPFLPRPEVRVEAATTPQAVESNATVESLFAKGVGAPFTGAVASVSVKPGQVVKKNDVLFRMDASTLKPQLEAARAAVVEARNGVSMALSMRHQDLQPFEQEVAGLKRQIADEKAALMAPPAGLVAPVDEAPQGMDLQDATPVAPADNGSDSGYVVDPSAYRVADTPRLEDLRAQLAAAKDRLAERRQAWAQPLADAHQRLADANAEVRRLQKLIAGSTRRSPIDGVVSRVDVAQGQMANAGTTIVRVDNPEGFRVVTLVDQNLRDEVKVGEALSLTVAEKSVHGKLEKIVPGEDKELGTYWLWMRPEQPEKLRPGQQVGVTVQPIHVAATE